MTFEDKVLTCVDCGKQFTFSAGEQLFFEFKHFAHVPKRCKACKAKSRAGSTRVKTESTVICAGCGIETTVPFKPRLATPVLCRACFQQASMPSAQVSGSVPLHRGGEAL